MRACEIAGWGTALPERTVTFGSSTRYRVGDPSEHLDLLAGAARRALDRAGIDPDDLDAVVVASAAGVQPIPCTAALVMERIAPTARAAAFDVNSTCTSFITAVDIVSRYLDAGEYERVLVVSGDVGSWFLDEAHRESWELFSDAGAAIVLTATSREAGVVASLQQTWPEHAHDTELRGGLSRHPASTYAGGDPRDHLFDMDGRRALKSMLGVLPGFFARFWRKSGLTADDVDVFVPHQASPALAVAMRRLGIPREKYLDLVTTHGNMVSASVPFTLAQGLDGGRIRRGDTIVLCGTAAGLTANALALVV